MTLLITDLQNATTGTRELDARVAVMLEPDGEEGTYFRHPFISEISDKDCVDGQYWKCAISGRSLRTAPEYTSDLNAVIELIEREMPGEDYGVGRKGGEGWAYVSSPSTDWIYHKLTEVALLMAFVKARGEG